MADFKGSSAARPSDTELALMRLQHERMQVESSALANKIRRVELLKELERIDVNERGAQEKMADLDEKIEVTRKAVEDDG